ncbi:hypothetical protein LEP1GSC170_3812, partial [Leptospira interrogans serovar Bataviae str. HAI135]
VLLDKSTGSGFSISGEGFNFNNIGKLNPKSYSSSKENFNHKEMMDQAEEEILEELLRNGDIQTSADLSNSIEEDLNEDVPVLEPPAISIDSTNEPDFPIPSEKGELSLFF